MFGKAWEDSEDEHLSVIRSGGLGDIGLHIVGLKLHSVVDLLADLLGEGKLHSGAGGGGDNGDALLNNSDVLFDFGDGNAGLRNNIGAGDDGEVDGLVDTLLDWLGVGNGDGGLGGGDHGGVVASLLGDLLAVVVTVAVVSVSRGWLADGHHLGVADPLEGDLDSLGGGLLTLLLVVVDADLVIDSEERLCTNCPTDWVTLLSLHNDLHAHLGRGADSLESWSANLSSLNYIHH